MEKETFTDRVKYYFCFLESTYGFKVKVSNDSHIRPQTDGVVKYASDSTLVIIDSETGQVAVRFVRLQDDERFYIDPVSIHEYLNTNESEKKLLLSKDPKDQPVISTLFNQKFLFYQPGWESSRKNVVDDLNKRLKNFANWLKDFSNLCLTGNFSRWPEFYEYKIKRLISDELRRGGKGVVTAIVQTENGKLKTIERPIFQREMEHLERLQKEIYR